MSRVKKIKTSTSLVFTETIPEHLAVYIVEQEPEKYTAIDHATWRYIMKTMHVALARRAHPNYLNGLVETGISLERVPLISEMDECLRNFGWRAVAVSGFIPPAIFMEFQSLGILPIACDMRQLEHIAYTPAPDIVHEAAGHAPMIANPDYAAYLRHYGEISRKAIASKADMDVYQAIRTVSELKENPFASQAEIQQAEHGLMASSASASYLSEAAKLSRFYWWTVEYGLIGSLDNPLIYGAGLLSSVGESETCLDEARAMRVPFTLDCINNAYDITRPQPQLFVTPDFHSLNDALDAFASTMAFRQGGMEGLAKAKISQTVTTAVLDSGLQISGVLSQVVSDTFNRPIFLKYTGPSQLSIEDTQLPGHGVEYHTHGYSTPLGKIANLGKAVSVFTPEDWQACGFNIDDLGKTGELVFESGIKLTGKLQSIIKADGHQNRTLVASFTDCTVRNGSQGDELLFKPDWGVFDLGCGDAVVSVFGGPADRLEFMLHTDDYHPPKTAQKSNATPQTEQLISLYQQVRQLRDAKDAENAKKLLPEILEALEKLSPQEWLLRWEALELNSLFKLNAPWATQQKECLLSIMSNQQDIAFLIQRGLRIIDVDI